MENNKFTYSYYSPDENQRKEIENIRKQYLSKDLMENKFDKLKKLNSHIKKVSYSIGFAWGVIAVLTFGCGLSLILSYQQYILGSIIGIIGFIIGLFTHPLYKLILKNLKNKHRQTILTLCDELLPDKEKE